MLRKQYQLQSSRWCSFSFKVYSTTCVMDWPLLIESHFVAATMAIWTDVLPLLIGRILVKFEPHKLRNRQLLLLVVLLLLPLSFLAWLFVKNEKYAVVSKRASKHQKKTFANNRRNRGDSERQTELPYRAHLPLQCRSCLILPVLALLISTHLYIILLQLY